MDIKGEYVIPAPQREVWDALNEAAVLRTCIPGCERLEMVSATEYAARLVLKIGAVKAGFKADVTLSEVDAPNSYTISGQGQGGVAGFFKGSADVVLSGAANGGTTLRYQARTEVGGKLAAVGSRVIEGIARKMADDFFGAFAAHLQAGAAPAATAATATGAPAAAQVIGAATSEPAAGPLPGSRVVSPRAPRRELPGTVRDLIWFAVGSGVGTLIGWALAH